MHGQSYPYGQPPANPKGVALPDPGTLQSTNVVTSSSGTAPATAQAPASGELPGHPEPVRAAPWRLQRAPGLGGGVEERPSRGRDGPPGRLLVAADPDGGGHPRAGEQSGAADRCPRRGVPGHEPLRPARPRARLRLERHLGRPGHHRHLRGQALRAGRRPADAQLQPLRVRGQVPAVRRAHPDQLLEPDRSGPDPGGIGDADHPADRRLVWS